MPTSDSAAQPVHELDVADQYGRRVAVHISRANFDGARRVIDAAETELNTAEQPELVSRQSLAGVMERFADQITTMDPRGNACLRVLNYLENFEGRSPLEPIIYVHQLLATSRESIAQIPNVGRTITDYLTELMQLAGFVWPLTSLFHQPLQAIVDDETALRLQESGYLTIEDIMSGSLSSKLRDANWLPSEIQAVKEAWIGWEQECRKSGISFDV